MDEVKIGLDFGTHQTKVCVQITPDEGHGEPYYEFFTFKDLEGKDSFFLPSTVQINNDDTLSYGYVDKRTRKDDHLLRPVLDTSYLILKTSIDDFDMDKTAQFLYDKYSIDKNLHGREQDINVLKQMLGKMVNKAYTKQKRQEALAKEKFDRQMKAYQKNANVFRYFKYATFAFRDWNMKIPAETLSVWYITYILFLLEEKYGKEFSVNMGVPTDNDAYHKKQKLAVEILLTAYHLVENVYHNDITKFLSEKLNDLLQITKESYQSYSQDQKDYNFINVFPEAYAGLISLTAKGRLATGMNLTVDIGGGTTDISFFTIQDDKPVIYRYWSIPYGLNYIAERSGLDYQDESLDEKANTGVIADFNERKARGVSNLISDLIKHFVKENTSVLIGSLHAALRDRVIVYSGGGSALTTLTTPIEKFTDVKIINASLWKEENIINKKEAIKVCRLLSTSYGLCLSENDSDVKVEPFTSLFESFQKRSESGREIVDKDMV